MCERTIFNMVNVALATTSQPILSHNKRRKALIFSVVCNSATGQPLGSQTFTPGLNQSWPVPNRVTSVADMYHWGSGGDSGAAGAALGGGGGGGGSFATTGPLTVVPGDVFTINVSAHGAATTNSIINPSGTIITTVGDGLNGALDLGGNKGTATVGVIKTNGGNGRTVTGDGGVGGGGGGAGGNNSNGASAAGQPGGAGGGAAVLLGFGAGGIGGAGANINIVGNVGLTPGGGAGGSGKTAGAAIAGAPGQAVVIYDLSDLAQAVSIGQDQNKLTLNQGMLNWLPGDPRMFMVTDDQIGDSICQEWYAIAGISGEIIQIGEYLYAEE